MRRVAAAAASRVAPIGRRRHAPLPTQMWLAGLVVLLAACGVAVGAVAPTIDYSHNMRILKLPKSTPVGELIYRLKGSDGDPDSRLTFGVASIESRQLIDVVPVAKSWNEADVYLRSPLEEPVYNLTIFVSDNANMTTQVESTILVTQPDGGGGANLHEPLEQTNHSADWRPGNSEQQQQQQLSPFVEPTRNIFNVPENTQPGETIGSVSVLESQTSDLPVRFELRGSGADKFAIRYVFGPQGHSKGELVLAQQVDFEKQNLFSLRVLALNAWTNTKFDTRNVATRDLVIAVGDVQDSPPYFTQLPASIRVVSHMQPGDLVCRFAAEDADYADPRPVQFALDAGSPLVGYFDIDKSTGELRLARPARELALTANWHLAGWSSLAVFASEVPETGHGFDRLWPPMFARVELPLSLVEELNEAPEFLAGWQTNESLRLGQRTLHGFLREPRLGADGDDNNAEPGDGRRLAAATATSSLVRWYTNSTTPGAPINNQRQPLELLGELAQLTDGRPVVLDLGLGLNGTFELRLEGPDAHLFQLEPRYPVARQSTFNLFVASGANRSLFDADNLIPGEQQANRVFLMDLVATDFGSPQRLSSKIKLSIELLDADDNAPQFDQELYAFSVYENAQLGHVIGNVRARDPDRQRAVKYVALTGSGSQLFHLDQTSGTITLEGQLDREKEAHYMLVAEAQDASAASNYTKILLTVLDVNDNAPIFSQQHYDAVLQGDGTFQQPLVVSARDEDEPNSANSQIAYEIIAGNQNDQFAIDALSGVIYPNNQLQQQQQQARPIHIPSILSEPIVPYDGLPPRSRPDQAGKILPPLGAGPFVGREIEETTPASRGPPDQRRQHQQQPAKQVWRVQPKATEVAEQRNGRLLSSPEERDQAEFQLPALDLLLQSETSASTRPASQTTGVQTESRRLGAGPGTSAAAAAGPSSVFDPFRLAPLTTLVVRAHDFGIPLRSSTCKVNIYNLALQTRTISLILNGTLEQLEPRRELLERSFGALTGSRAIIESLEMLSDSSSICIARVRLAAAPNSLVDLTDLGSLMTAVGYKHHQPGRDSQLQEQQQQQQQQHQFRQPPTTVTHYIAAGDRIYPASALPHLGASNLTSGAAGQSAPTFYTDINSIALDTNALERKLLIYIIIVGVCILTLLVIWMIYSCSREDQQVKIVDASKYGHETRGSQSGKDREKQATKSTSAGKPSDGDGARTHAKMPMDCADIVSDAAGRSAIGNNLMKSYASLAKPSNLMTPTDTATIASKRDHLSMYNGQVWFEPAADGRLLPAGASIAGTRRASSAPSGNSLDSALVAAVGGGGGGGGGRSSAQLDQRQLPNVPRSAVGQFFPNTVGYIENLASLGIGGQLQQRQQKPVYIDSRLLVAATGQSRRNRRRKVAPATPTVVSGPSGGRTLALDGRHGDQSGHSNQAFEPDLETGASADDDQSRRHEARRRHQALQRHRTDDGASLSSTRSCSSESQPETQSVFLDSDQELLGFDSTGTPIIATHTRRSSAALSNQLSGAARLAVAGKPPVASSPVSSGNATRTLSRQKTLVRDKNGEESESKNAATLESSETRIEEPRAAAGKSADAETSTKARDTEDEPPSVTKGGISGVADKPDDDGKKTNEPEVDERPRASGRRVSISSGSLPSIDGVGPANSRRLAGMQNAELVGKQSIFELTYNQLR